MWYPMFERNGMEDVILVESGSDGIDQRQRYIRIEQWHQLDGLATKLLTIAHCKMGPHVSGWVSSNGH